MAVLMRHSVPALAGRAKPTPRRLGVAVVALFVLAACAVIVAPIGFVIAGSFWSANFIKQPGVPTLHNYWLAIVSPEALRDLRGTLIYTLGSTCLALVLGTALAVIVTRVRLPFPRVLRVLPMLPLFLPGLLKDVAWIELYSKKTGLINIVLHDWLGVHPLFNIYSMTGMIVTDGVTGAALPYLILLAPLASMDHSLEEASLASGAGRLRTLFTVTLPVLRPSLISAFALTSILVACEFETPMLIGRPGGVRTYMSQLYASVNDSVSPNYDLASAQAMGYLVLIGILLVWYLTSTRNEARYVLVAGRGYRASAAEVGPWRRWSLAAIVLLYFLLSFAQLVAITVLTSLIPFYTTSDGNPFRNPGWGNFSRAFASSPVAEAILNSVELSVIVSVAAVVVATILSFVSLKTKWPGRRLADVIATLPIGIPSVVFSAALLITLLSVPGIVGLYGTKVPLVVADVVVVLPFAVRVISSALISVHDELLESSASAGAGGLRTLWRIVTPMLAPALIGAGALVCIRSFLQLGAVIFLTTPNFNLLPTEIFTLWGTGDFGLVAALNVISVLTPMVLIGLVLVLRFGARYLSRRLRERRWREDGPLLAVQSRRKEPTWRGPLVAAGTSEGERGRE